MRTIDEYRREMPPQQRARPNDLRPIVQDAVRLEALTGDPDFDYFLRYLEAAISVEKRNGEQFMQKLRAPFTPDDEMCRLKAALLLSDCRVATLEEILALPKMLKTQAEKARAKIEEMERDSS